MSGPFRDGPNRRRCQFTVGLPATAAEVTWIGIVNPVGSGVRVEVTRMRGLNGATSAGMNLCIGTLDPETDGVISGGASTLLNPPFSDWTKGVSAVNVDGGSDASFDVSEATARLQNPLGGAPGWWTVDFSDCPLVIHPGFYILAYDNDTVGSDSPINNSELAFGANWTEIPE